MLVYFNNNFGNEGIISMNKEQQERLDYTKPEVEVIEFQLEESIASSGDFGSSTICGEELF
jgi:hypothetical protein